MWTAAPVLEIWILSILSAFGLKTARNDPENNIFSLWLKISEISSLKTDLLSKTPLTASKMANSSELHTKTVVSNKFLVFFTPFPTNWTFSSMRWGFMRWMQQKTGSKPRQQLNDSVAESLYNTLIEPPPATATSPHAAWNELITSFGYISVIPAIYNALSS